MTGKFFFYFMTFQLHLLRFKGENTYNLSIYFSSFNGKDNIAIPAYYSSPENMLLDFRISLVYSAIAKGYRWRWNTYLVINSTIILCVVDLSRWGSPSFYQKYLSQPVERSTRFSLVWKFLEMLSLTTLPFSLVREKPDIASNYLQLIVDNVR